MSKIIAVERKRFTNAVELAEVITEFQTMARHFERFVYYSGKAEPVLYVMNEAGIGTQLSTATLFEETLMDSSHVYFIRLEA